MLHKKDQFESALTINESLALKELLAGSICFQRQYFGQALEVGYFRCKKRNPLVSLTIRDLTSFLIKAESGRPQPGFACVGVHCCPDPTQLVIQT